MSSLSKALSKRIPLPGDPLGFLPKNLFWKEARQLLPLLFGLLALQIPVYLVLFFEGAGGAHTIPIPLRGWLAFGMGTLAVFGTLFFALENEERTSPFLFRMPVSRRATFWNKIAAALAIWIALILASALLFLVVKSLWPVLMELILPNHRHATLELWGGPGWRESAWYLSAGALAFLCCARVSLGIGNALPAFLVGVGLVVLIQAAILFLLMQLGLRGKMDLLVFSASLLNAALCVLFGANLWRRFRDMEEPSGGARGEGAALWSRLPVFRRQAATLKSIEFREKAFLWGILILAPIVHILIRPNLFAFFWLPFAGIVSGVTLWSRSECDGVGFFLHHQPISRKQLYRRRIVTGLGFNAACLLVTIGLLLLAGLGLPGEMWQHEEASNLFAAKLPWGRQTVWKILGQLTLASAPANSGSDVRGLAQLWAFVIGMPLAQFIGFYAGVLISPLRRGNVLGVIQAAILTFLIVAPTIAMWQFDIWGTVWAVALIWLVLSLLSGWTNVRSRAMEPGVRKAWRIAGLGAAVVLWAALVNLVDPLDLLYLVGVDVYRWM